MEVSTIIRLCISSIGVFILGSVILSLAKRRMTETFSLAWGVVAVIFILAGIMLHPTMWANYVSITGIILIFSCAVVALSGAYFLSVQVSVLSRKNQELAMQVSLLNQENEQLLREIRRVSEETSQTEEGS